MVDMYLKYEVPASKTVDARVLTDRHTNIHADIQTDVTISDGQL